jgi:hypothetical protein
MTERLERAIIRVAFSWPYLTILAATLVAGVTVCIRQNARETMDPIAFLHVPIVISEAGAIAVGVWAVCLLARATQAADADLSPNCVLVGGVLSILVFAFIAALPPAYLLFFHIIALFQRATLVALFTVLFFLVAAMFLARRVAVVPAVAAALAIYVLVEAALVFLSAYVESLAPLNDVFIVNQLSVALQTKFVAHSIPICKYAYFVGAFAFADVVLWVSAAAAFRRRSNGAGRSPRPSDCG